MNSLFSWPKMLGTCALLAFTAGAVIQEMSPRSDLYQQREANVASDLGLSNITYASAQFNYRNYGPFGDRDPRINSSPTRQIAPIARLPEKMLNIDSGCSPKVETNLDDSAIVSIKVISPCTAFADISAHHMGLAANSRTDATGSGTLFLPLLSTSAVIFVDVGASQMVTQTVSSTYLEKVERTVLSWSGNHDLRLTNEAGPTKSLTNMQVIDLSPRQRISAFNVAMVSPTQTTCDQSIQFKVLNAKGNQPVAVRDFSVTPEVCDTTHSNIQLKSIF